MTRDPTAVRMQPSAWAVDAKEDGRQSGRFAEGGGSTAPSNFPVPCSRLARPSRYAPGRPPSPRWYRRLTSAGLRVGASLTIAVAWTVPVGGLDRRCITMHRPGRHTSDHGREDHQGESPAD